LNSPEVRLEHPKLDLLLTVLPRYTELWDPPAGVAYISAAAKTAGFRSKVVDFNLIFTLFMRKIDKKVFQEIDCWMAETPLPNVIVNRATEWVNELSPLATAAVDEVMLLWTEAVVENNPKYLGLSIFTGNSRRMAKLFIPKIKAQLPNLSIICGGSGTSPFDQELRDLVDFYVEGEGEQAIVDILRGETLNAPGVNGNNVDQLKNLDDLPWPDYSDLPLAEYDSGGKSLRITGSRGCTRRCNFCNVYLLWPKYTRRSAESLVNEMLYQNETLSTHPTNFTFSDSLINGHMDSLRQLCRRLIDAQRRITFIGQFIALGPRFMPPADFDLLRDAGCSEVYIGIESGSEALRRKMNKLFSNEDLKYCIEQLQRVKIKMTWLLIVGFPDETDEEFELTCQLFEQSARLNSEDYKIHVSMHEFIPFEEVAWVQKNRDKLEMSDPTNWTYLDNPTLDRLERRRRLMHLERLLIQHGYVNTYLTMSHHEDFSISQFSENLMSEQLLKVKSP
jgi:radical SAM superfamily enzyme YgiQ (UPF0313 family)